MTTQETAHTDHEDHGHHVMPLPMLFGVFGALIFFTALTVAIGQFELGRWEIIITMAIATFKATLVAVFFMHLLYDRPFNGMIFGFSLIFVALFLGIVLMDVGSYENDLVAPEPPAGASATETTPAEPTNGEAPATETPADDAAKAAAA